MKLLLQGEKSFFPSTKAIRLPITKDILTSITSSPIQTINDLKLDAVFKVTWAGFMRLGEITYTETERGQVSFKDFHLTRSNITFSENDQYATLRLKRSKTDTNQPTCPLTALRRLFTYNQQPAHAPLFAYNNNAFNRRLVVDKLRERLSAVDISSDDWSGHGFRRGAA